ncbi:uncharacterized protein LOC109836125 [Asparagus officinalis]|uniref:uncharacterized protein LOC109836125 n=1 Tax=Asparagus officinalis TaxID=4686 RepID=UPI00098E268E|nr:uncharacterized protein LOC109836125 [Asparagus officinalis]
MVPLHKTPFNHLLALSLLNCGTTSSFILLVQEALENTYSEVVAQSQEPLTREQNYNDIQEELMRVIQPTATFAMVSRQIMKSCRRRVPTRVQSQIMNFLATQKAFTGSGESSRQGGDDAIGSTSRRDGAASGNADDDMDRADDLS